MATPEAIKISSDAVFKKDKMIGFLSEQESRGVNWVLGNVKGGLIIVSSFQEQNKPVTIEISKAASNIDPKIIENQITFKVSINIEATMQEKQSQGTEFSAENLFNEYDYLQKLADETSKVVQKEIVAALAKTQGEYKSDVFGFGSALNRKFPQIWDENKDKWDEEFPKVHVIIRVQTVIKRTGQLMGSFKYP